MCERIERGSVTGLRGPTIDELDQLDAGVDPSSIAAVPTIYDTADLLDTYPADVVPHVGARRSDTGSLGGIALG